MSTVVRLQHFPEGGQSGFSMHTGLDGWCDSALASKMPFEDWWKVQTAVMAGDHSKVIIEAPHRDVGGILLVQSVDAQVGECLVAFHQFLHKDYRGASGLWRRVLRLAEQATRDRGLKWLVWTHRDEAAGRIYLTHKEV